MPLIQTGISTRKAKAIIDDMNVLLAERRVHKITRGMFLRRYGTLRYELEETFEYKAFHLGVTLRSKGICERCGKVARHVHHKVRIAMNPDLACEISNGEHLCKPCHQASHPKVKLI